MSLKNGKWRKFWFFTCQLGWPFPLFLSVGDPLSADPDPQYCWMRNQFGSKSTILPVTNNPSVGSSVSLSPISLFLYYLLCRTSAQPWPASWSFLFNFCLRDIQYGGGGIFITFSQWLTRVINRMLQIYWNSPIQRFWYTILRYSQCCGSGYKIVIILNPGSYIDSKLFNLKILTTKCSPQLQKP